MFRHTDIEKKWQSKWLDDNLYQATGTSDKKFFCLDMFPYPSGSGLHVGHVEGYSATDIYSRYMRMQGYDVIHPMGWDAFGLPAENFAIKQKVHPTETTKQAIEKFKSQLNKTGLSFDWSRELNTSSPDYYKWTQWLFLEFYRNGLAYKKLAPVNWCPSCQTVLANEQVIKDGEKNVCERCGSEVVQKDLKQWFLKITDYSDRLLTGLDGLDWPESTKSAQRNWIGKQEGFTIHWKVINNEQSSSTSDTTGPGTFTISTFTKFPETIFGATFISVAPEYADLWKLVTTEHVPAVEKYIEAARKKTAVQRKELQKDKSGVFTGSYVVNPVTGDKVPVYVADYVLIDYGTGAVFGCPGHDVRDFYFAKKLGLEVKRVVKSNDGDASEIDSEEKIVEEGTMMNSGFLDGLDAQTEAKEVIKARLEQEGVGEHVTFYNLRDWLVSRQRYWGAPIPIIYCSHCAHFEESGDCCGADCGCDHSGHKVDSAHDCACSSNTSDGECGCESCGSGGCESEDCGCGGEELEITEIDGKNYAVIPVPDDQLPVLLPTDVDFRPTGESPLARSASFQSVTCPRCGAKEGVKREVDTLDTFVDSSWYFIRFADPKNSEEFASPELIAKWLPVDLYVGGDHATTHLIFARFFTKVLFDLGYLDFEEPFTRMRYLGLILGEDGRKMSKRWGNIVNPDDVIEAYGADTMRTYEMFMGPFDVAKAWSTSGVEGVRRFYNRVWALYEDVLSAKREESSKEVIVATHRVVRKVGSDIENIKFNTAVASMMEYVNFLYLNKDSVGLDALRLFVKILAPFGPFITEELWEMLGESYSIHKSPWPKYDEDLAKEAEVEIPVQVNGKIKARLLLEASRLGDEAYVKEQALAADNVREIIKAKEIKKYVYAKGKIVNIVTA